MLVSKYMKSSLDASEFYYMFTMFTNNPALQPPQLQPCCMCVGAAARVEGLTSSRGIQFFRAVIMDIHSKHAQSA